MKRLGLLTLCIGILSGCEERPENLADFNDDLREVLQTKPSDLGAPAALVKEGAAGKDWLATVHGYPNNREVCEQLIKPYNDDPSMSAMPGRYSCEEIRPG